MLQFQYEDAWYYNNYHVLGHIFVFPHFMKVTLFDARDNFRQMDFEGLDYDWYKNEDEKKEGTQTKTSPVTSPRQELKARKKFVILKNTNTICFDRGDGKIQVYNWEVHEQKISKNNLIVFTKTCSLNNHSLCEVIDRNLVTVMDLRRDGDQTKKLFNVESNSLLGLPDYFRDQN